MTTLNKILIGVVVVCSLLGVIAFFRGSGKSFGSFQQGQVQNDAWIFTGGLAGGSTQQFSIDGSGNVISSGNTTLTGLFSDITSATTSPKFNSTSATQGTCFNVNATSSATAENMTFTGSAVVVGYGVCK